MSVTLHEQTLLDFISTNWTLADEGLTSADIAFTLNDVSDGKYKPQVWVRLFSFERMQEADTKFKFTFIVSVHTWNTTADKSDSAQLNNWKMVDHIYHMFDDDAAPSGWDWAIVQGGVNAGIQIAQAMPEVNQFDLTITACLTW